MVDYPEIAWFQKEKRKKKNKKKGCQEIANISEENRWIFFGGGEDKGTIDLVLWVLSVVFVQQCTHSI